MWVTENQLDEWVRARARDAQGLVVELVLRLVAASVPKPRERRFPLADSIGQHGPDGRLDTDLGFEPFVPDGRSLWEIGTSLDARRKATQDYKGLTESVPAAERCQTTFVFVTPLSGVRGWEHTWQPDGQARWLDRRRQRHEWKDVRIIDGTKLVDWVGQFPAVGRWLFERITGIPVQQVESPDQRWEDIRSVGAPLQLGTQLFLANRKEACDRIAAVLAGETQQAKLDTLYPDQVVDFVCAYLANLEPERHVEVAGRCLIVSGLQAWTNLASTPHRHILVADAALDLSGDPGTRLIQRAQRGGHAVIFGGPPSGAPDRTTSAALRSPSIYQVEEALHSAGYGEQRAKSLAQRSGGNLGSLLRCIKNLSILPAWSEDPVAGELAMAAVLGAWADASEADRSAVERLVGISYGEWIGRVREAARRPGTPLIHQDGRWRFVPHFEGWYALGPRLFDEHLDRLRDVALAVLGERDPQFELDKDARYAASVYGKVLAHSRQLRVGLADALALMGSHPRALTSCSLGKAEVMAVLTVRALLAGADWMTWAGLDDVLPLLAEAAPGEFLDCLERMLDATPEVIDALFAQEGDGITGRSYLTGLLWALETLAWEPEYFGRVVSSLGEMAARDPGGRRGNRPANSLREILLPWYPQTCAPVAQRSAVVATLLREQPAIGWKLVLALLPTLHDTSMPTRRPAWRPAIPDTWTPGVTRAEHWAQIENYAQLAVDAAQQDVDRLADLISRWADLPLDACEKLYAHLDSGAIAELPADLRQRLWTALVELVAQHRKFADAKWAMGREWVDRLAALAERLTPTEPSARYRRLFSQHGATLYDERGNYEEQARRLEQRRQAAVAEIATGDGAADVVAFAQIVDVPWQVGVALGQVGAVPQGTSLPGTAALEAGGRETTASGEETTGCDWPVDLSTADFPFGGDADAVVDAAILPMLLAPGPEAVMQFAGGFVRGRFHRYGWRWVDTLDMTVWTPAERGQFFASLPFVPESWDRAERVLGGDAADYWTRVAVNPYQTDTDLEHAVDALLGHGRPEAAADCLASMVHKHRAPEPAVIARALMAMVLAPTSIGTIQSYEVEELIKALQADPRTTDDDLFRVEWAYLPLLSAHHEGKPKFLMRRLASDPAFFCDLIRLVFRPRHADNAVETIVSAPEQSDGAPGEPPAHAGEEGDDAGDVSADAHEPHAEAAPAVAENAHRLLREWSVPPGMRPDGSFDGAALVEWIEAMQRDAAATGHLEVAMMMLGHVLTHVPPDPDGLWIYRSAAMVLNVKQFDHLREGFRTQTLNARGAHWVDPTGAPEDELARMYRGRADEVEAAGCSRLATTVREIAASYTRLAEHLRAEHRAET